MDPEMISPVYLEPLNWLKTATIYNKRREVIPYTWLEENADAIALLFTSKGVDRDGIVAKFYQMYESCKFVNVPIEVIYIPFDESREEYEGSYEEQANWFTLPFDDTLVSVLKYLYGITCLPHIIVVKPDCTVVSSHGLLDLEQYGKNAVITWLQVEWRSQRDLRSEEHVYGAEWHHVAAADASKQHKKRYSAVSSPASASTASKLVHYDTSMQIH